MSDLTELLRYVDPSSLSYQEWVNVGMALKHEGYSVYDWDNWSARDGARYHAGECVKKWESFREDSSVLVTGGTIYQMAVERGYSPPVRQATTALDWDDEVSDDYIVVDSDRVEALPIMQPGDDWKPVSELIRYLDTLYNDEDIVGYVTKSWVNDAGKHVPTQGAYKKTAGQLISELRKCNGDLGSVMGDYDPEVGAWIRFNPLDGKGCKNSNVVEYRFALVECDNMDLAKQNALIHELEFPVACLVYSGGKSIHAIVKVDAADYKDYRKRVDYLYKVCKKNGLSIDEQNKNPSRLSRMPGIWRGNNKQFLIDTNIGKESWNEWQEWIESVNDDLPEPEALESVWDNMPELSPPLIDHVLRQGHKMLIAGPSKAGKSFLQIEMCIAIAEGRKWLSWQCAQGRVMYVNLELDRPSCLHRFKDVYNAMGIPTKNLQNIDIWNLRGNSIPMDKLAPKLIRRAAKKDYIAIVIDPIYKVITGDENSADQMANFCNQFDKVCNELGCAVIYCHHHSKGSQGNKKSMDRASGSGVFARDPDALLDLIELEQPESLQKQETSKKVCRRCLEWLEHYGFADEASDDDRCSEKEMLDICRRTLRRDCYETIIREVNEIRDHAKERTAWRLEGTLREFPKFPPVNMWFEYPIHTVDQVGVLKDIQPEEEKPAWQRAMEKRKDPADKKKERLRSLDMAYEALMTDDDSEVTVKDLEEYFTLSKNAIKNRIKEHPNFYIENGIVVRKQDVKKRKTDTDTPVS